MASFLELLNAVLRRPTAESIFEVFEPSGFIRLNMLYASPLALMHLRDKLAQYSLVGWWFTDNELVFRLADQTVVFRGMMSLSVRDKIYCLELDFDPIIADNTGLRFLHDIEVFLKKCDACFFMTYLARDEISARPLGESDHLTNKSRP
eukprot:Pompholyxophrys_punicea_v1_NODE_1_length_14747_cov_12.267901.p9 type:complete len:149 gc:universal NODE_1_length_14747_cov_12.267901:11446-11000(-)